jgi:para-aminobenzoate synthetase
MELKTHRLDVLPDPELVFASLYGESENAFWLDSSRPGPRARFSFMGDADGPLAEVITYDLPADDESILDYLTRRTAELRPLDPPDLPFEFDCGFVGYLGYELKSECGHEAGHPSDHPDACFILADRLIAFDHDQNHTYLLCLHHLNEEEAAEAWISATERRLESLATAPEEEWGGGGGGGASPLLSAETHPTPPPGLCP